MNRVILMLFMVGILLMATVIQGATIRIPDDYPTIQQGIDAAADDDTVMVAKGIYSASVSGDVFPLVIDKGIVLISESGPAQTWLDAENLSRLINCTVYLQTPNIVGFKMYRGKASKGGAIYCDEATLRLEDNVISGCTADSGGAVYSNFSDIEIVRGEIIENTARFGGGIFSENSLTRLLHAYIGKNESWAGHYQVTGGAGVYGKNTTLSIYQSVIDSNVIRMWGNYPKGYGSGIYIDDGFLYLRKSEIKRNTHYNQHNALWGAEAFGGGVYCKDNWVDIDSCIFHDNECWVQYGSIARGGAIYIYACVFPDPKINHNLFYGNRVWGPSGNNLAGGIFFDNSFSEYVSNNTMDNNEGGGIYSYYSSLGLLNNIVVNSTLGGGIVDVEGSDINALYNDVWNNEAGDFIDCSAGAGDTTWGVNANGTPCDQYYNIRRDPLFKTDPESLYWLTEESSCRDAGSPSFPLDPDGSVIEIGAFYFDSETDVPDLEETLPSRFELKQNYPNPFNPVTTICYSLPARSHVQLTIHNVLGQRVVTLVDEVQVVGYHQVFWNAAEYATGIYLYRLQTDKAVGTKKMLLVK